MQSCRRPPHPTPYIDIAEVGCSSHPEPTLRGASPYRVHPERAGREWASIALDLYGPALAGPRLTLRSPHLRDIPRFRRWLADPEVARYWWTRDVPWAKRPALAALVLFVSGLRPDVILWTIAQDGNPIGHCLIRKIDRARRHATAAVLIGERAAQGKGFAAEAIAIRNKFVFESLHLESLSATALAENAASRRVLEKSGYRLVGVAAGGADVAGRRQDLLVFELTRNDYTRQQGPKA